MKTIKAIKERGFFCCKLNQALARALLVAGFFIALLPAPLHAGGPGGFNTGTNYYFPEDIWSFYDATNWTSDYGYAPVSFTNLNFVQLGNGRSLAVDTNIPAWLQFNVLEGDGTTNLSVDSGTVMFWFAPGSWSSTNAGGTGPGVWGRMIEAGAYTSDSSYGWWSLYVDDVGQNLYFSAQTNDLSSNFTNYITVPISWTTNYFHFVALTYSPTNTALYFDGVLATNGPGVSIFPGPDVLADGFCIGSDYSGEWQAHGLFNTVATYNVPLDASTIQQAYSSQVFYYQISPWNTAMASIASAPSTPSFTPTYNAITGQGNLQLIGSAASCSYGTNAYNIWFTNAVAKIVGTGTNATMNLTFTIEGGWDNVPYDVFANSALGVGTNNQTWAWMGQGYHCNIYMLTNLPSTTCFLIMGTPQDTDGDGLTDAYENLVSHTNPNVPDTSGDGLSDSDKVLLGLNPLAVNPAYPASPSIQTCP